MNETITAKSAPALAVDTKASTSWKPILAILAATTLVTAWLVFASVRLETSYLNNYGFFYDPAAYYTRNIELYQEYLREGRWATALHDLTINNRDPLRTIPYLLFAPDLLKTVTSHLWTEVPLLWGFLALFASTVYKRTQSLIFAICATSVFTGLPFLYDPAYGLATFWLDLTAAFAMGSAALCLVRFAETKQQKWMFAFGAFASATALCRWSAACYLVLFVAIAVPAVLFQKRFDRQYGAFVLKSLGCALITALPGLAFTLYFFESASSYYTKLGYALNAPISQSIAWTTASVAEMLSTPILCLLAAFSLWNAVAPFKKPRPGEAGLTVACLWLPVSVFIFICVICKAVNGCHPLVYFAPSLMVSAFCPLGRLNLSTPRYRVWWHAASAILLTLAVGTSIYAYEHYRKVANSPMPLFKAQKQLDMALGRFISATHAGSFIQFDTQTIMPQLEAFYTDGTYCFQPLYFSVHDFHLKGLYPRKTPDQVASAVYADVNRDVALVAVFQDPEAALKPGAFTNAYTSKVSHYVSQRVAHDPSWKFLGTVNGPRGVLAVYKNTGAKKPTI